ncbi:MAG: hypothetical protein KAJ93_08535, partial [Methanosarcinales archaeon]|nr:hypothetical protein [Methanosarcinales archaeon]
MKLKSLLPIIIIIGLLFGVAYYTNTLSTVAPPALVPVEFEERTNPSGYTGIYWVGTAQISGSDVKYRLVPAGVSYSDAITMEITGIDTKWVRQTEDDPSPLKYNVIKYHLWGTVPYKSTEPVPYLDTISTEQKLESTSIVTITSPTSSQTKHTVSNYGTDSIISVNIKDTSGIERTAYFKFQGITLSSGDLPPGGDLSLIEGDISDRYRLVTKDNLVSAVSAWNSFFTQGYIPAHAEYYDDYNEIYKWMSGVNSHPNVWPNPSNRLPDRTPGIANNMNVETSAVVISYPTSVFSPTITFYIPAELAEYVVLVEQEPEFIFDSISEFDVNECGSSRLKISGTATGSGTILLSMSSDAMTSVSFDEGSEKQITKGTDYDFWANINWACGIDADKKFQVTVYSDVGGLGTDTSESFSVYMTDKDTATTHTLTVSAIYADSGDIVETAEIYIGSEFIGYGSVTKSVPQSTHTIYSNDIDGWYTEYSSINPL